MPKLEKQSLSQNEKLKYMDQNILTAWPENSETHWQRWGEYDKCTVVNKITVHDTLNTRRESL